MRSEYDFFNTASTRWRDMMTPWDILIIQYIWALLETKHKGFIEHHSWRATMNISLVCRVAKKQDY